LLKSFPSVLVPLILPMSTADMKPTAQNPLSETGKIRNARDLSDVSINVRISSAFDD